MRSPSGTRRRAEKPGCGEGSSGIAGTAWGSVNHNGSGQVVNGRSPSREHYENLEGRDEVASPPNWPHLFPFCGFNLDRLLNFEINIAMFPDLLQYVPASFCLPDHHPKRCTRSCLTSRCRERNPGHSDRGFVSRRREGCAPAARPYRRPLSTSSHAPSAGSPITVSRARFNSDSASPISGVRPKLAPRRI